MAATAIDITSFRGSICATGPAIRALAARHALPHGHPPPSVPHVALVSLTEPALPPAGAHALRSALERTARKSAPLLMQRRTTHREPSTTCNAEETAGDAGRDGDVADGTFIALFWPQMQEVLAASGLPRAHFHLMLCDAPPDSRQVCRRATDLDDAADSEALAEMLRAVLRWKKLSKHILDDVVHTSDLLHRRRLRDGFPVGVASIISETRVVAHIQHSRHVPDDAEKTARIIDAEIRDLPSHPPLYLHRAAFHFSRSVFQSALYDVWFAALVLQARPSTHERISKLLAKLSYHVMHIGLDYIYMPLNHPFKSSIPQPPFEALCWHKLTYTQRHLHDALLQQAWRLYSIHPYNVKFKPHAPPTKRQAMISHFSEAEYDKSEPTPLRLPRNFSLFCTPFVVASAVPSHHNEVRALTDIGVSLVVSLCVERPLPPHWFENPGHSLIRNVNITIPDHRTPSFPQMDAIIAYVAQNSAGRTLVHCVGGKGRTGTVLACLAVAFGGDDGMEIPALCAICREAFGCGEPSKLFVGSCAYSGCALEAREPVLHAKQAIALVRAIRPPSVERGDQERFVHEWGSELWRRSSIFSNCDESINRVEVMYPTLFRLPNPSEHFGNSIIGDYPSDGPSLIVLCGLPGSGKSHLSAQLEKAFHGRQQVTHASQDELGSRDAVCMVVGNAARNGDGVVIVDRVNATKQDRALWLEVAFKPRRAIIVHMATHSAVCIARAQLRIDHKTLQPCAAEHVVEGLRKTFQVPGNEDIRAGFSAVVEIRGEEGLRKFLHKVGGRRQHEAHLLEASKEAPLCVRESGVAQMSSGDRFPNRRKVAVHEGPDRLPDFYKFPRTRHMFDGHDGQITSDDVVLTATQSFALLSTLRVASEKAEVGTSEKSSLQVTLEEKVDGANLGFSIELETGQLRAQNRSHYVTARSHEQFIQLHYFMQTHGDALRGVCELGGRRHVLYGEWLYATHSVRYTRLPSPFLAFDILDVEAGKFLSRDRFKAVLQDTGIDMVPQIKMPNPLNGSTMLSLVDEGLSAFGDNLRAEGLYIRVDDGNWLVDRAKVVRSDFIAGNQHWKHRQFEKNSFERI